jgi:hypothetical protein
VKVLDEPPFGLGGSLALHGRSGFGGIAVHGSVMRSIVSIIVTNTPPSAAALRLLSCARRRAAAVGVVPVVHLTAAAATVAEHPSPLAPQLLRFALDPLDLGDREAAAVIGVPLVSNVADAAPGRVLLLFRGVVHLLLLLHDTSIETEGRSSTDGLLTSFQYRTRFQRQATLVWTAIIVIWSRSTCRGGCCFPTAAAASLLVLALAASSVIAAAAAVVATPRIKGPREQALEPRWFWPVWRLQRGLRMGKFARARHLFVRTIVDTLHDWMSN